ncbi:MAG: hypothetical protein P8X68_04405 [Desulfobacterales bacterium]|jgi:hypothetical protein
MREKKTCFTIGFLLIFFFAALLSCATEQAPLQVLNSLPQSQLAYYNDPFDRMREDLWDRAGYVFSAAQMANIKIADMAIENGRLRIDTKTGGFSKGGLVSTFTLRGNFDVQADFQIDFVAGKFDMDQLLGFAVVERTLSGRPIRLFMIGLLKKAKNQKGEIFSSYREKSKYRTGYSHPIDNFNGSLRFVRTGKKMSTFYRKQGQNRWIKMCTLPCGQNDASIGFGVQNFIIDRNSITATRSISAWIDNFTINTAQQIIESEI